MKIEVLCLIAGLLAIVQSVATGFETVWVRDVTKQIQADKRALGDHDLPDQLTFNLRRGLDRLTLNLMRNYEIDPNADMYVAQELKNGQSFVAKTNDLEQEAVAYYQDIENMAFMTVRCIVTSNQNCDRVINGNVQIGNINYDLRPVDSDYASGRMSKVPSLIGKRYVLLDHAHVENKDAADTTETNIEEDFYARLRLLRDHEKQKHFRPLDTTLSRYITDLQDKELKEKTRQQRHDYYVKVAVLIDSGVWDLYASTVSVADPIRKDNQVRRKLREAYSHIFNGVNLRYKTIDDPSISITLILQQFTFFQQEGLFPHNSSKVDIRNGKKYINAHHYKKDLSQWVQTNGINMVPVFDHAMLFTGYELYKDSIYDKSLGGVSPVAGVCDDVDKISLIKSKHYSRTVITVAHELGHNLGAQHDGTGDAKECNDDEAFIMHYRSTKTNVTTPYYRNSWLFSTCSVESFKKTLISKDCVKIQGSVYNTYEWSMFMMKEAGDFFTPNMQCYIIYGPHHVLFGVMDESICQQLRCKNLKTREVLMRYLYAARGTQCGQNKDHVIFVVCTNVACGVLMDCVSQKVRNSCNPLDWVPRGFNSRVRPSAMQLWEERVDLKEH